MKKFTFLFFIIFGILTISFYKNLDLNKISIVKEEDGEINQAINNTNQSINEYSISNNENQIQSKSKKILYDQNLKLKSFDLIDNQNLFMNVEEKNALPLIKENTLFFEKNNNQRKSNISVLPTSKEKKSSLKNFIKKQFFTDNLEKTNEQIYQNKNSTIFQNKKFLANKSHQKNNCLVNTKKLSEIIVSNNKYTKSSFLKKRLKIKKGDYLNKRKLQEHLNFINLNPFRKVEMIIDPLDNDNCNIDLLCYDRFFLRPYIGIDNTGLKNLDRNRAYAGFNWNNPFRIDSVLSYQYLSSLNFQNFQAHTGNWTVYLPWENILSLFASYAYIDVDHMIPYIIKHHGSGLQASLRYTILLPIIKLVTHDLIFGFDFKRTDTNLLFSRFRALDDEFVNLSQFLISYSLNWNYKCYHTKFLIELYLSAPFLCDEENYRYNNFRRFAKNNYVYAKAYFSNLLKLPKDFLVSLMLTGQLANMNLLPSETFPIGGYNTVRGYFERQINTDSGFILNIEARSPSISFFSRDSLRFIAFLDYGFGKIHKTIFFEEQNHSLLGFGPGIRYVINPYLTTRLDWGIRGNNKNIFEKENSLIHFSVNLSY